VIDAKVKDVLRRDMRSVQPETEVGEVARLLSDDALPSLPVVEDGRVVGVISQSDLLFQELQDEESVLPHAFPLLGGMVFLEPVDRWREQFRRAFGVTVRDVMTTDPVTITEDETLHEAARRMVEHDATRLPVVNAQGGLVGVVSRADIVRALASEW
jgi:CBS domain-containing protein